MRTTLFLLGVIACRTCFSQDDGRVIRIPVIFHVFYFDNNADNGISATTWEHGNSTSNLPLSKIDAELKNLHDDFLLLNTDTSEIHPAFKHLVGNAKVEFFRADTILQQGEAGGIKRIRSNPRQGRAVVRSKIITPEKYLNIYIGGFGSAVPSATPWTYRKKDAIFLNYKWVGQGYRLLTHETGHWLGLVHIYGGSGGRNGDDCKGDGDGIADTPPQRSATDDDCQICPPDKSVPMQGCISDLWNYNNYMDYSGCRKMFTREQVLHMREVVRLHRPQLWNSIQTN